MQDTSSEVAMIILSSTGISLGRFPSFMKIFVLIVSSILFLGSAHAANKPKTDFPRLGGVFNGKTPYEGYEDPEYHKLLARLDLVILGFPRTWKRDGLEPRDVAKSIKKRNPDLLLGQYTILGQVNKATNAHQALREKISSEKGPNKSNAFDWWARDANGNQTSVYNNTWYVNLTEYVKPDGNGRRWPEHLAKVSYDEWFFAPEWDLWYADSTFVQPRSSREGGKVDWTGGAIDNDQKLHAAYRRGHAAYWTAIKKLRPDMYVMPNLGGWAKRKDADVILPEYYRKVGAGQFEGVMGRSWSNEAESGGWYTAMDQFRLAMSYLKEPKIMLFNVTGEPKDYQFFRYAFASALMDNGYFSFRPNNQFAHGDTPWFDEYDAAGTRNTRWLGKALKGPSTKPWKKGVYRRDFENGIALVNPKENGKQTVTIEPGFVRINGKQDSSVNNGKAVTSVTLKDRDGIILVRSNGVVASVGADPRPPTLIIE